MEYFTVSEPLIMVYVMKTVEEWGIQGSVPASPGYCGEWAVESGWRLNRKRAQHRRLILARDRDMIVGAYRPVDGSWREEEHDPPPRAMAFPRAAGRRRLGRLRGEAGAA